ncbi:MAG: hypothetical protein PHO20_00645 [Candidatus Peribacteraceae bacterium]|nr:hypothetical protein [Candidatus Peribacteraceae bacterium]MDD5739260.1 hypothetical protein [Candidatus Peribacteraceae bacterium]
MSSLSDKIQQFVKRLQIDGCKVQVGSAMDVVEELTEDNCASVLAKLQTDNSYYLSGVRPEKNGRASDADILKKNGFTLDFDLLKDEKNPRTVEDIKQTAQVIIDALKEHPVLGNWSAVIFSGGGLHFTYFGDAVTIENPDYYKSMVTDLHHDAKMLLPRELKDKLDPACVNAARLFRLPGTKNYKYEPPREVEILQWNDAVSSDIPAAYERGRYLCESKKEAAKVLKAAEKEAKVLFAEEGSISFYHCINKLIPIQEVVCTLKGWETDGRNFWEKGTSKKKACFVPEEQNHLVHGGTDHLPPERNGYSVFQFVQTVLGLNNKQTFEWFEEEYPAIKARAASNVNEEDDAFESKAEKVVALALSKGIKLFHDQFNEAFARVPIKEHFALLRCSPKSNPIRDWLNHLFWKSEKKPLFSEDKIIAIEMLASMAKYDGEQVELQNRVAYDSNSKTMWYDLSDTRNRAVRVQESGWELCESPPILFYREQHQRAQAEPSVVGGNIKKLLEYVNIAEKKHQLLYLVYVVSCFIPHIPHPIAVFYGKPGSAKSTATKITKGIVDPSRMDAFTFPRDTTQLVQQLSHHWCAAYDNIDYLTDEQSDALCRATTGGGFSKRVLYTDDDDKIYYFRRCILLNGVNQASTRSDLLDRSLLFSLERIPDAQRKTERELYESFQRDLPIILGGIFDVLVETMKVQPHVKLSTFPRMADFAEWGCAIAVALGYSQDEFEAALEANKIGQNDAVLSEDWLAPAIQKFMADKDSWVGCATELVRLLEGYGLDGRRLPKANKLSRHLQLISIHLEAVGIRCERGYRGNERILRLDKISSASSEPTDELGTNGTDATDDNFPNHKVDF